MATTVTSVTRRTTLQPTYLLTERTIKPTTIASDILNNYGSKLAVCTLWLTLTGLVTDTIRLALPLSPNCALVSRPLSSIHPLQTQWIMLPWLVCVCVCACVGRVWGYRAWHGCPKIETIGQSTLCQKRLVPWQNSPNFSVGEVWQVLIARHGCLWRRGHPKCPHQLPL